MLDRSTWVIQANSPCWSLQRFVPVVCSGFVYFVSRAYGLEFQL